MCTAVACGGDRLYFGRTLDHTESYGEEVVIAERNFPLALGSAGVLRAHYAMVGMAHVAGGTPLFYDGMNEAGLCVAGLHFVGNAQYKSPQTGWENLPSFGVIPFLLARCADTAEAERALHRVCITDEAFSAALPAAPLHWLVADAHRALTVECTAEGLRIYENPVGVLTNNPPFPMQLQRLNDYIDLSPRTPTGRWGDLPMAPYSYGMGALGLPGDLSSASRFVRAAFMKTHTVLGDVPQMAVERFFRVMDTVVQPYGCCETEAGVFEQTLYTSCCDAARGIYHYNTFADRSIKAVPLEGELAGSTLRRHPLSGLGRIGKRA